jgi:general secretion pathway protein M
MRVRQTVTRANDAWNAFWRARNWRERSMLMTAAVVCVFGLLYVLLIDPAVSGTASLSKSLPLLRQQAAQMRQLATQVTQQAQEQPRAQSKSQADTQAETQANGEPVPPLTLTRDAIDASLKRAGLSAAGISVSERGVQLQFASTPPAGLIAWLEQVEAQQLSVSEAQIDMLSNEAAKASVTLTKTEEERQ